MANTATKKVKKVTKWHPKNDVRTTGYGTGVPAGTSAKDWHALRKLMTPV